MKNKKLYIILLLLLSACAEYSSNKVSKNKERETFYSSGFALIYEESLYINGTLNKKMNNDELLVHHKMLKSNTPVRIINPSNSKSIDLKIHKKAKYPKIFNMVISKKLALNLELDFNDPFLEIIELKKNETFIAKEGTMFEEEKNVADKAPVDEIKINDLTINKTSKDKKEVKKSNFILVISDFYFENSAINLKEELMKKINIDNISVKKINDKKYRLLVGPFKTFNALKTSYISLNNLGFENLNIYKE